MLMYFVIQVDLAYNTLIRFQLKALVDLPERTTSQFLLDLILPIQQNQVGITLWFLRFISLL